MRLDILAFGAHPDDVELGAGGTLLKHVALGNKVGIIDLTRGELGTRGSAELREEEATNAGKILGLSVRENLGFADGFFVNDKEHQLEVVKMIRKYRPKLVIANAPYDRHPDHGRGSEVVKEACFIAGLRNVETQLEGEVQEAWRPKALYHYIQFLPIEPDILVDISGYNEKKMEAVMAYSSQFYNPKSDEPSTAISSKNFIDSIEYGAKNLGRIIGVDAAEGFVVDRYVGTDNLFNLI